MSACSDDTADADGNGELEKEELELAIGSLQSGKLTKSEFDDIWSALNPDGKPKDVQLTEARGRAYEGEPDSVAPLSCPHSVAHQFCLRPLELVTAAQHAASNCAAEQLVAATRPQRWRRNARRRSRSSRASEQRIGASSAR